MAFETSPTSFAFVISRYLLFAQLECLLFDEALALRSTHTHTRGVCSKISPSVRRWSHLLVSLAVCQIQNVNVTNGPVLNTQMPIHHRVTMKGFTEDILFILIVRMCVDVERLDKVSTTLSRSETCITESMSPLQPYLSVCSNGPWDDFVAGQTSFSPSPFSLC